MKKYEMLLVLPGTLEEKEAAARAVEVVDLVKEVCGAETSEAKEQMLGKNRLAYPVKNIRYGYFFTIVFSAEPSVLPELQKRLNLLRDLLRAVVTHFDARASASQKITYFTDSLGATNIVEEGKKEEAIAFDNQMNEERVAVNKKIDLKEIDKKLDEILQGDLMPEV